VRWWVICGFSSAFGSAFYPLFNPQIRMSANPHFTRSRWNRQLMFSFDFVFFLYLLSVIGRVVLDWWNFVSLCLVNDSLKELLMKLLKRWKHSVKEDRMHQYLVRVCFYSYVQYICSREIGCWLLKLPHSTACYKIQLKGLTKISQMIHYF